MSCMVHNEKGGDEDLHVSEPLVGPLRQLKDAARRVATVCNEAKLELDVEEYVQGFRPDMMDIVYAWCNGSRFVDLCAMTKAYEGSIIRVIRRLEELMRQLGDAAKVCGLVADRGGVDVYLSRYVLLPGRRRHHVARKVPRVCRQNAPRHHLCGVFVFVTARLTICTDHSVFGCFVSKEVYCICFYWVLYILLHAGHLLARRLGLWSCGTAARSSSHSSDWRRHGWSPGDRS